MNLAVLEMTFIIITKEKIDGSTVNKKKYLKKNMITIVEINNG